jgi:hypothetical protein
LLIQRELARYLVEERGGHYHFTVKANQKKLLDWNIRVVCDYLKITRNTYPLSAT